MREAGSRKNETLEAPLATSAAAPSAAAPAPNPSGREILRMGVWNYVSNRWAPKNTVGRWVFDIGVLVAIFLPLAILYRLAAG